MHEEEVHVGRRRWNSWLCCEVGWWVRLVWRVMLVVRLSRGVARGVSSGVHQDILGVTCLLSEVSGESALPKVGSVVKPVILV